MKMVKWFLILIFMVHHFSCFGEILEISLKTYNNEPVLIGHALLLNLNNDSLFYLNEAKSGKIIINHKLNGYFRLRLVAINHKSITFPIFFRGNDQKIKIEATLEPIVFTNRPQKIPVIGNFNNWNFDNPLYFEKVNDSIYELNFVNTKDLSSFQYQIVIQDTFKNEPVERSVNGLEGQKFFLDKYNEDYISELPIPKSNYLKITLNINKYPQQSYNPKIVFLNHPEYQENLETYLRILTHRSNFQKRKLELENKTSIIDEITGNKIKEAFNEYLKILKKLYDNSKDSISKELLAIEYLTAASHLVALKMQPFFKLFRKLDLDVNFLGSLLNVIKPTSQLWGYSDFYTHPVMGLVGIILYYKTPKFKKYLDELINFNPNNDVRIEALNTAIEIYFDLLNDKRNGNHYLQILTSNFPYTQDAQKAEKKYGNKSKIKIGSKIPNLHFNPLVDNKSGTYISLENFKGKYVLLDFWATWCGPCVAEFPFLQEAYTKYKDRGLIIISVSFDKDIEKAKNFLSKKNYDWIFCIENKGFESQVAKDLEIYSIPYPILINSEGTVVAKGSELRGKWLLTTLKKYLK